MNHLALVKLLQQRALQVGETKVLASGKSSNIYINCKDVTLHGPSLWDLSGWLTNHLLARVPTLTHVAGVSVGGDPIVAGMTVFAHRELNRSLASLLVRKEPKKHGASSGRAVEGEIPNDKQVIWLVEDVISSGGSADVAARHLEREGYRLAGVLAIVDREMGGVEHLKKTLKIEVETLVKLSALV